MKSILVLIVLAFSFSSAIGQTNVIFINELMAKNDSFLEDDKGNFSDWIELYNSSNSDVNIGGYYLTDDMDTLNMWKIPSGTTIPAKAYLLFWASGDNSNRHTNFKLSVTGETLALVMPDGTSLVDTIKFPEQTSNVSYGRTVDGAKTWIFFEQPTPNAANTKPNSDVLPVVINELMASNSKTIQDETGAYPDWFELYNNSDEQIDISGFYLTDKPMREPSMWRIPEGTVLNPRAFLLIWADSDPKDGPYHTNFNLGKDGDSIAIYSVDGKTLVDMIAYKSQQTDVSWGRRPDGAYSWMLFYTPTPGKTNSPIDVEDYFSNIEISNFPNPFNEKTEITVILNKNSNITLAVYDIFGRKIEDIFSGYLNQGKHNFRLNSVKLQSGMYFCRMQSDGYNIIQKIIRE
ncbi:MAG: lamin tail domain-containing protein [bacterium]